MFGAFTKHLRTNLRTVQPTLQRRFSPRMDRRLCSPRATRPPCHARPALDLLHIRYWSLHTRHSSRPTARESGRHYGFSTTQHHTQTRTDLWSLSLRPQRGQKHTTTSVYAHPGPRICETPCVHIVCSAGACHRTNAPVIEPTRSPLTHRLGLHWHELRECCHSQAWAICILPYARPRQSYSRASLAVARGASDAALA